MIDPKCLKGENCLGHSARGYLVPCCFFDNEYSLKNDIPQLIQEKLNLANVDSINEILQSAEWLAFLKLLEEKSDDLPYPCHYYCGENRTYKVKE